MSESQLEGLENDWQAIRAQFSVDETAREREVLKQRAGQYAELSLRQRNEGSEIEQRKFVTFTLAQERYGIEVAYVRAIRPLTSLTWIPGVPAFYRGVINLKGRIISVLDIRYFFDLEDQMLPADEYLVTQAGSFQIALLASHVHGIESIAMNEVQPIETLRYAYGVNADRITLLNLPALFEDERLLVDTREV